MYAAALAWWRVSLSNEFFLQVMLTWRLVLHIHLACPLPEQTRIRLACISIGTAEPPPWPKLVTRVEFITAEAGSSTLPPNVY